MGKSRLIGKGMKMRKIFFFLFIFLLGFQTARADIITWSGQELEVSLQGRRLWGTSQGKLVYLPATKDDLKLSLLLTGKKDDAGNGSQISGENSLSLSG